MSFALGGLAVMSSSRPLTSLLSRFFALIEIKSMFLSLTVCIILLVLAYLTNPSETSFRAFLTEQAFRQHLSRLDDADGQEEADLPQSTLTAQNDLLSRRGPNHSPKQFTNASQPLPFANRASVSLRTPKHIFRSFGIMSIAAVVPSNSPHRSSLKRGTGDANGNTTREAPDSGSGVNGLAYPPLISDSWFIGAFGMWFWAANLDGLWKDAGIIAKDEVDGTISGVLEVKRLDRLNEGSNLPFSNNNIPTPSPAQTNVQGPQRAHSKGRPRERFHQANGHAHGLRSSTPPPLPKSASLPLHTKRGAHSTPEKNLHHAIHSNGPSISSSTSNSSMAQISLPLTPETRSISSASTPASNVNTPLSTLPQSASPSRTASALFASSPMIAELLRQISASQTSSTELRTQLADFKQSSASAHAALQEELEIHRARKRADDASKNELKARTKALEDQKRSAESARREVEKRLKTVRARQEGARTRADRLDEQVRELHVKMETQGAAIVSSGVEAGALAEELEKQVEGRKREVREVEEEIAQLGVKVREMEEKVIEEEKRLERAYEEAEERKRYQESKGENAFVNSPATDSNAGAWHALPHVQTNFARPSEKKVLERSDVFPPSPLTATSLDSPLTIDESDAVGRRKSIPSAVSIPIQPTTTTPVSTVKPYPIFDSRTSQSQHPPHGMTSFSPFNEQLVAAPNSATSGSPGPLSPMSESLIPSSLYESLGMPIGTPLGPSVSSGSVGMDVSRSFQSDDDIILDRDWLNARNRSAGDVGSPLLPSASEASPVSPTGSGSLHDDYVTDFDPFQVRQPIRYGGTRMDMQRASFAQRPFAADYMSQMASEDEASTVAAPSAPAQVTSRRSGWFTTKDKIVNEQGHREKEKKGLNPTAKEFSLSKDKERSFVLLTRAKGPSTPGSGSGSSSTPSTASSITTPESAALSTFHSTGIPVSPPSIPTVAHPASKPTAATSLFGIGSSWFGASRAFAPTPTEREHLARVLGGSTNNSLDRLPGLNDVGSLPASPQPKPAMAHIHSPNQVSNARSAIPAGWLTLADNMPRLNSTFSPFSDEAPASSVVDAGQDKAGAGIRDA